MKMLILCLTLAFATSAFAIDKDECTFDFANAQSALDAKSAEFFSVKKINKNEKEKILTQDAVFKKGKVKVKFTTGGCAHYGYSFVYTNLKQKTFTADQAFRRVIELLKSTPTTEAGKELAKTLIENLETAAMNKILRPPNEIYEIPCGDAQCELDAKTKGTLKASYSFAL